MWLDWVSNPGPLPLKSDALPTALRGPTVCVCVCVCVCERERERRGAYTVMSSVGNSNSHFSLGKKYYMYVEKLSRRLSHVLKISAISLVLRTREISDIFNTFDEIYLVFTEKK